MYCQYFVAKQPLSTSREEELVRRVSASSVGAQEVNNSSGSNFNKGLSDLVRGEGWVGSQNQSSSTSNVGAGHGSSANGVCGSVRCVPGGFDEASGGKDLDASSVVGIAASGIKLGILSLIADSGGTDSDGTGLRSRRNIAGILVLISSSNNENQTTLNSGGKGIIESLAVTSSKRHVGNSGSLFSVGGSPLNSRNDSSIGTRTSASENLNGNDRDLLGNTIQSSTNSSGNVSSVTIAIGVSAISSEIGTPCGSSSREFSVGGQDTSVNDESNDTASFFLILVSSVKLDFKLGDSVKSPDSVVLNSASLGSVHDLVSLDVFDMSGGHLCSQLILSQVGSISLEGSQRIIGTNVVGIFVEVGKLNLFRNVGVEDNDPGFFPQSEGSNCKGETEQEDFHRV
jgi:hypothetical protein